MAIKMIFPELVLPTEDSLKNPVANLIRNSYRPRVEELFSMSRSTEDDQYSEILYARACDMWRTAVSASNDYAINYKQKNG